MKELRTRLKKLLMEAGFTQAELAEMVENCKDNIRMNITVRQSRQSGVARATCPD